MNSTDLAHALGVPMDTPGCWAECCPKCQNYIIANNKCLYCDAEVECLWPMPDSGLPGAELWTYWLMRALDKAGLMPQLIMGGNEACVITGVGARERRFFAPEQQAALYAAYKESIQ